MAFGLASMSVIRDRSHLFNYPIISYPIIKTNCCLRNSISVLNHSCFLSLVCTQQPITCAKKSGRRGASQQSRKLMFELASMVALNLKILPQPLNFLIGEFAQTDGNGVVLDLLKVIRGGALDGWRKKKQSSRKLSWFVLVSICGLGLMCWKILELDMFLRVSCFFLVGLSMIQLWQRKAFKEWILGFLFGIVLLSCKIGKEDMKFWVERLKIPSSVAQIVTEHGNRSKRKWGKAW